MIHVVDMYPTLAALAGASTAKAKSLDGLNVWSALKEGKPSPRSEIIYNVEPFRAGIREGDWKLIWRTPLPSAAELFNLGQDPSEKNNLAAQNPEKVAELQKRANELAATMVKPLLLETEFKAMLRRLGMPPALPGEECELYPNYLINPEASAHSYPQAEKISWLYCRCFRRRARSGRSVLDL